MTEAETLEDIKQLMRAIAALNGLCAQLVRAGFDVELRLDEDVTNRRLASGTPILSGKVRKVMAHG